MYKVELWHYREAWRNGDREDESVIIRSEVFKTRKEAKAWILNQVRGKKVKESWHRGNEDSHVWYETGKTWIHENTGEECRECFTYVMSKK